jgi:CheY-like chemotaxis protein
MDAATKEKIFEPYFTTREIGEGTGLGLALVHGIVKRHNGAVTVQSEPGRGTSFQVYLPKLTAASSTQAVKAQALPQGTESVLLVDYDETIIRAGKRVLESLGYQVTVRTNSQDAFKLLESNSQQYDLLITDYTMPGMTGADLALKVAKIRPDMPIILCTGYSEHVNEERAKALGIREYLMKPFVRRDMAEAVRRALDVGLESYHHG